ncbi:MFS transporter [Pseudonocardia sp. CA-107938]|uniref:MFS transporter n=1 Tax=Pseudonocardia sp. CA-107938 TaxID=3240021 RepID=UPI003D944FA7
MAEKTAAEQNRRAVLNTLKGSSGNLVEWYDVYIYTVFLTYFEKQFFSAEDTNSLVYGYAIFAVTFVMRPVGSWYFGRYADRYGRRAALTFSVTVMAACSFVIAVTPTRGSIGVAAVVILILCRLVQGFATGGEYGTSATYMSEAATKEKRGFFSSFQYVTLVGGQVLATLTLLLMLAIFSEDQIRDFGWRIPFFIGGLGALVVLWMRRTMDESLSSEQLTEVQGTKRAGSLATLFTEYWKPLLLCFLITMGGTIAFYTYSVNAPAIVKATYKDSAITATWINLGALVFLMVLQPIGGMISDRVGRKPLLVWFGVGGVIYTYVLITFLPQTTNPALTLLLLAGGFIILTGYTSINALVKSELFPFHIRALGVGLGYALANSVFGGTAPGLYELLKNAKQVPLFIGYVTVCIAISLVVYVFALKNKADSPLDLERGSAFARDEGGARV